MRPSIHYCVTAKLFRNRNTDNSRLIEFNQCFFHDNPIIAREKAFRYYQNFIDVLVDATGLAYRSDSQARDLLTYFIDPDVTLSSLQRGHKINSLGYGIGVFLVIDHPIHTYYKKGAKYLIHGIGNLIEGSDSPESLILGLETEYEYYQYFKYNSNHLKSRIVFCDSNEWEEGYRDEEPSIYTILKTPFDWTGMDKPYWWVDVT